MIDPSDPMMKAGIDAVVKEVFHSCFEGFKALEIWTKDKGKRYDFLGKAAEKYANALEERYNSMRIFGMNEPVQLRGIFINVNILESIIAHQWKNLDELIKTFDLDRRGFGKAKETISAIQAINKFQKLTVLGKPGSGKTTLLKNIALQTLDGKLDKKLIPIFITLKAFADSEKKLMDFIVEQFDICQFPEAEPYVERILSKGRCIILFDGLDEVNKEKNNKIVREIQDFSDKYRDNNFILSCRTAAYNDCFEKFKNVELADFTDDQIEAFINNWFGKGSIKAESCWEKLERPENKPIKELASTPLLLTLLCIAFDESMDFPRNRAEIYEYAINALLGKWDASRNIERDEIYKNLSNKHKKSMFSRIAAETFSKGQFFIPHQTIEGQIAKFIENLPEAKQETIEPDSAVILKAIEAQHGIFVERAHGIYSFSHLTIQEYFTAKYVVDNASKGTIKSLVQNHFTDDRWREVFLITAGMLENADSFLLMMKQPIDSLLTNADITVFLGQVQKIVDNSESSYHPSILKSIVIYLASEFLFVPAPEFARELVLALVRNDSEFSNLDFNELDFAFATNLAFDRELALDLERDLALNTNQKRSLTNYLKAIKLLVDCLNTDCYVSKGTRQKILDSLLTVSEN